MDTDEPLYYPYVVPEVCSLKGGGDVCIYLLVRPVLCGRLSWEVPVALVPVG